MRQKKSFLIIAGEQSGEEHAQSFLDELVSRLPQYSFFGVGGSYFREKGVDLLYHLKEFSSMGFSEVIKKIPFYFSAKKRILEEVDRRKTKYAILIDFQGFNLSLAVSLKKKGIKVFYYVAPQAWAWKAWRAQKLEFAAEVLFSILPFEEKWFRERGVRKIVTVKHPVFRKYEKVLSQLDHDPREEKKQQVLFLPGSRNSEVKYHLPIYEKVINALEKERPDLEFAIVKTDSVDSKYYDYYGPLFHKSYQADDLESALGDSILALASSGTVTLTCGLFGVPCIVCYKVSLFNEYIFKNFINYQGFVSLTNIILEEEVFPELLGEDCIPVKILQSLRAFLNDENYERIMGKLSVLRSKMESAHDSAAPFILESVDCDED